MNLDFRPFFWMRWTLQISPTIAFRPASFPSLLLPQAARGMAVEIMFIKEFLLLDN
jgi:hypothetical protein